ncbi:hypothetical protein Cfor_07778 [Coptotermes formosanus]|uniref:Uncharacterized protein n=1 Tax=Coptotermes formosanus TaxID=36987 RepID=A0A6L2PXS9_COPFO|nr:hypothetical protein Cfor_07778 [Coptotermes formosanus]
MGTPDGSSSLPSAIDKNDLPPVAVPVTSPKLPSPRPEITVVAPVTIRQSPSPPSTAQLSPPEVQETIKATSVVISRGPRKSVSIVLPGKEHG